MRCAPIPVLVLSILVVCGAPGCRKIVKPDTTPEGEGAPEYVPAPASVVHSFAELGPTTFGHVVWGEDADAITATLELDRYHVQESHWGLPGREIQVVEVRDARLTSTTAFLYDGDRRDLRTILIREIAAPPPPQLDPRGFLPFLEPFPGKIAVLGYPEEDGSHAHPYRFLFFDGLGIKIGLTMESDSLWYLDHVEFFDPTWAVEDLATFKYGGQLLTLETIGNVERKQATSP